MGKIEQILLLSNFNFIFLKRPTFVELILDPSNVFLQFPKDFPTYKISNYFRIEFPKNCTLEN